MIILSMLIGAIVMGCVGLGALVIYAMVVKMDMDADYKDLDKELHIKHIERMDRGTK